MGIIEDLIENFVNDNSGDDSGDEGGDDSGDDGGDSGEIDPNLPLADWLDRLTQNVQKAPCDRRQETVEDTL